jgi:hypothetical protein
MIKLEDYKIYVDSHKMEMVPYSIAVQAVKQAVDPDTEKYLQEVENALNELRTSLNNIELND